MLVAGVLYVAPAPGAVPAAISSSGLDPQHLAAQVARVGRRLARVGALGRAVLHRRVVVVAVAGRHGVVADTQDEVAVHVEVQAGAADVARRAAGGTAGEDHRVAGDLDLGHAQDHALRAGDRRGAELVDREAADLVVPDHRGVARGGEVCARGE